MKRTHAGWIVPIAATLGVAWACAGLAQDQGKKTGERVGEKVDGAVQDIKSGLRKVGGATRETFARAKTSVHNMDVESRVYGRIHWDKALNDATIELSTTGDGAITLEGTVATSRAKVRAVELAQETVGVTRVVDRLAIRPATANP